MSTFIIIFCIVVLDFILFLILKNYLPSYMEEKAKNLATKEDIQRITDLTESVQQNYRKDIEQYKSDLQFRYDFYYKQYEGLYCYIYAIVIQSEYMREFIKKERGEEYQFEEVPFLTITPPKKITMTISADGTSINEEELEEVTPVSEFNFDNLVKYIIQNSSLAEHDLMKYAVGYRFANHISDKSKNQNVVDDERIKLQGEIVKSIVKTYNRLRKELKIEYSQSELESGIFEFLEY